MRRGRIAPFLPFDQVRDGLRQQVKQPEQDGFDFCAVILKANGAFIGAAAWPPIWGGRASVRVMEKLDMRLVHVNDEEVEYEVNLLGEE